jgi:uncharacterized protein YjgD (DUF1641 family)
MLFITISVINLNLLATNTHFLKFTLKLLFFLEEQGEFDKNFEQAYQVLVKSKFLWCDTLVSNQTIKKDSRKLIYYFVDHIS